jgi:tetratricopeptide (TPR) repeat protein/predicted Ser/Thr protein kinase
VARGSAIGRFLVLEKLGEGGMGVVYAAYDPTLNRRVALKLLQVAHAGPGRDSRLRLIREAQALAQLSHPGVVAVYEVGEHQADVFIAMELVEGATLKEWLGQQPRTWREVLDVCIAAGRGLAAAHAAGLVHRDFKPLNVLVGQDGRARVMDFGIARAAAEGAPPAEGLPTAESLPARLLLAPVTQQGRVMGTPAYMAPEQLRGQEADARSDLYSFCVSTWEALYGERPQKEHAAATPPPRGTRVPSWVHAVLVRGLCASPEARPPSMHALLEALSQDPSARRRRWLAAAAAGALLAGTSAGVLGYQRQLCRGAEAKLAGVWDEARRSQVQAALVGTGASFAPGVWLYVRSTLDAYAQAWARQHTEACEATTLRGEQSAQVMDLRMACLHRARVALDAAAQVLATADARVVGKAHEVLGNLDTLARCADVAALRAEVEPPGPEEAAAVERMRGHLAVATAQRAAARYPQAKAALEQAGAALGGAAYGPARTELALERGEVLMGAGDFAASEAAFRQVVQLGARWKQWKEVRRAATALLHVVGYRQMRPELALQLRELARGLVEQEGDAAAEALLHNNLGNIFWAQGKHGDAQREYQQALALREKALGPEHPDVAGPRNNLGTVLREQGRHAEAEAQFLRALQLWERALGPEHPNVGAARNNLGGALLSQGKNAEAEEQFRLALALRQRALGPEHPDVGGALNNLGGALVVQGKHAEAEAVFRHALRLRLAALGPEHPSVAFVRDNLGSALSALGRREESEAEYREALRVREKTLAPEHPQLAVSRHNLAALLRERGRAGDALALAEGAWAVRQRDGTAPQARAETAFLLARLLWHTGGDRARARALAERAAQAYGEAGEAHAAERDAATSWLRGR